jgi:hypothetical protein
MSFGFDLDLPGLNKYLCIHVDDSSPETIRPAEVRNWHKQPWRIYLSYNGTPWGATTWLLHPPESVRRMAEKRQRPEGADRGSYEHEPYEPDKAN